MPPLAILLVALAGTAVAAPTKEEAVCQQQTARQLGTAAQKRIKCLVACDKQALKGKVPATNCVPPYAGPTRTCVDTVMAKADVAIAKKCDVDCPECWAGGDCDAYVSSLLTFVGTSTDGVVPLLRCDDSSSPDGLTKAEAKVRQKAGVVAGTYLVGVEKCLATCRAGEAAGKIPAGACDGLGLTDPKSLACVNKVVEKSLLFFFDSELDTPECLDGVLGFAPTYLGDVVDDVDPQLFCASPSGAFVDQNPLE